MPEIEEEQVYPDVHKKLMEEREPSLFGERVGVGWHMHNIWEDLFEGRQAASRLHRPTVQPYSYTNEYLAERGLDTLVGEERMREWRRRQARQLSELQDHRRPRHYR